MKGTQEAGGGFSSKAPGLGQGVWVMTERICASFILALLPAQVRWSDIMQPPYLGGAGYSPSCTLLACWHHSRAACIARG